MKSSFMSRSGLDREVIDDLEKNPREFTFDVKFPNRFYMKMNMRIWEDKTYIVNGTLYTPDNLICLCTGTKVNQFRGEYSVLYNDSQYLVKV